MLEEKIFGALNDKNDPTRERRDKHADLYYETRRNSKKEHFVKRVAKNSGLNEKSVSKIFDHVFIEEHDIHGEIQRFDPSYEMAESFRRLSEGKNIQPHDIILLRHERLELELMRRYNCNQGEAHTLASRKHNYSEAVEKFESRGKQSGKIGTS